MHASHEPLVLLSGGSYSQKKLNHTQVRLFILFFQCILCTCSRDHAHRALLGPLNSVYVTLNTVYSKIIGCILLCIYHSRLNLTCV